MFALQKCCEIGHFAALGSLGLDKRNASVQLPGIFNVLAPTLNHYGYLAVAGLIFLEDFGTPFVPGETVLIAGSLYAANGKLNVITVGLLAILAAILGDNVGYAIGRFAGHSAVVRWGRYVRLTEPRIDKAEAFFRRHGGKVVVLARFIDGLRQINGIVAGTCKMRWTSFLIYNALGATLWVACWVTVGYTAGRHITAIYNWFSRFAVYALVALCVLILVLLTRHFLVRHTTHGTGARRG
jgi:membrane protein DedA with SNARE-associated domain